MTREELDGVVREVVGEAIGDAMEDVKREFYGGLKDLSDLIMSRFGGS